MKKLIAIILCLTVLNSCSMVEKEEEIIIDNKYSIELPDFLSPINDLNEDGSLQYGNKFREFYVIIIDENLAEMNQAIETIDLKEIYSNDLNGYANLLINNLEQVVENIKTSKVQDTIINNLPAKLISLQGTVDNIGIYYSIAYLQGKNNYYQITSWTLDKNEDKYKNRMKKMIASFKEL